MFTSLFIVCPFTNQKCCFPVLKGKDEDGVDRMDEDGDEQAGSDEEAREDGEGLEEDNLRELAPGSYRKAISCLLS